MLKYQGAPYMKNRHLQYLVTGTGRCGTVYLAKLLTSLGIPCGHESIFDYQGLDSAVKRLKGETRLELSFVSQCEVVNYKYYEKPSWLRLEEIVAESSYMAAPYLSHPLLERTKKIHVVRDPIKVVSSFCDYLDYFRPNNQNANGYELNIYRIFPALMDINKQYERACLFYVLWNELIESQHVDLFIRIEDGDEAICHFVGKEPTRDMHQNKSENTWKTEAIPKGKFSLSKITDPIIKEKFLEMGRKYQYSMRDQQII